MDGQDDEVSELKRKLAAAEALVADQANRDAALRESETRHRLLIESWTQAIWETDGVGVVITDSPSWRAYTGQTVDEWLGYGWLDAIHSDDRAFAERQWREAMATGRVVDAEFRLRAPDGGWRWTNVRAAPLLNAEGRIEKWVGVNIDIDARKRAEEALIKSERRYRTLFESIDEGFSEMQVFLDEDGHVVDWLHLALNGNFSRVTGIPDITGRLASEVFPNLEGEWFRRMDLAYRTGEPQRFETELADLGRRFDNYITRVGGEDEDRVLGVFGDITARKQAEAALRESEERFRQFAEASASGLWIRNADTLAMEYVSPAVSTIYGVEPKAFLGDMQRWAALIVPEDRDAALKHMERALHGEPAVYEFRIRRPKDGAFRWIRNTDFPLLGHDGAVERIGGIAEDVTEAKLAVEHQGVLLAELQHRVRNIMTMIRSMALRTADGAVDVEDYRSLLEGRLLALARVQVLLTREANAGGSLRDVIASEISAQAYGGDQFELDGPDIRLSPKTVEVLTLAFHELATNALKYGAFSTPQGRLRVSWAPFEKRNRTWLALDWSEEGVPQRAPPTRRGFGSDLIEGRIPYELGGAGKLVIGPGGAHCHLEFPIKDGESILETDAPAPTKLFGGALDMTDAPDLTGLRVLVVEDDYYMAGDTAAALRGAGAEVLGPCPSEETAFALFKTSTPTHAILDLNLGGGGARFEIAHALRERGVPFIFLTGYNPEVIPTDLVNVVRLQKPVSFRKIIEAVCRL